MAAGVSDKMRSLEKLVEQTSKQEAPNGGLSIYKMCTDCVREALAVIAVQSLTPMVAAFLSLVG